MQSNALTQHTRQGGIDHVFERVASELNQIGLSASAWPAEGDLRGRFSPACQFCSMVSGSEGPCFDSHQELARRVISTRADQRATAQPGCCLMGVPVFGRRRLVGAMVASYPARSLLDQENLALLCDQWGLDRQHMDDQLAQMHLHKAEQAEVFGRVLQWQLEAAQSIEVAVSEIGALSVNLADSYEELNLLYRIAGGMQVTQHPRNFMENICIELLEGLVVEADVAIVYAHPPTFDEDLIVVSGRTKMDESEILRLATKLIQPRLTADAGPVVANSFSAPKGCPAGWKSVRNYLAVPLVTEEPLGMLIAINKIPDQFDSLDIKLTDSIASQTAVFIENNRLYADLQDLLMGVLHTLSATIDAKDPYTSGHSRRVALISKRLAEECGLGPEKAQQLYLSGLLHDIGKIGVPETTLKKKGRLTDAEFEEMKRHPMLSATILGGIRQLDNIIVGILNHHERPDGKGYPRGLSADQLPIDGLIVGLADSLDAMTSDRTYRKALPVHEAIEELKANSAAQFDPDLVQKLLKLDVEKFLAEIRHPELAPLT